MQCGRHLIVKREGSEVRASGAWQSNCLDTFKVLTADKPQTLNATFPLRDQPQAFSIQHSAFQQLHSRQHLPSSSSSPIACALHTNESPLDQPDEADKTDKASKQPGCDVATPSITTQLGHSAGSRYDAQAVAVHLSAVRLHGFPHAYTARSSADAAGPAA